MVPHTSRKTSEIWGTQTSWDGTDKRPISLGTFLIRCRVSLFGQDEQGYSVTRYGRGVGALEFAQVFGLPDVPGFGSSAEAYVA